MVLVIETSGARSAVAVLGLDGSPLGEAVADSGPGFDLPRTVRGLVRIEEVTKVAVGTGPGSFTGLRVGVAYGAGLALGRRLPVVGLPSLGLTLARAKEPAVAVSEAGRGRLYFLAPGGEDCLGEPADLPAGLPAAGWLKASTRALVEAAGVRLLEEAELRSFSEAAADMVRRSPAAGYDRLRLRYLQTFGALASAGLDGGGESRAGS